MKFKNINEINSLLNLLDIAVKASGLSLASDALYFMDKLKEEAKSFQVKDKEEKK